MNLDESLERSERIDTANEGRIRMPGMIRWFATLVMLMWLASSGLPSGLAQVATPGTDSGTSHAATCPPDSPGTLVEFAETWVAAVNAEDTAQLEGMFHEMHISSWAFEEDTVTGEDYIASLNALFGAFDDYRFTAEQILVSGDYVTIRWIAAGTQVQEFQGVAPSGEPTSWPGISVFYVECGQVTEGWTIAGQPSRV